MWLLRNSLKCWLELWHCSTGSSFEPPHHGLSQSSPVHYLQSSFRQLQTSPPRVWGRSLLISVNFCHILNQPPDNVTCLHLFIFHRDKPSNFACYSTFSVIWLCTGQTQGNVPDFPFSTLDGPRLLLSTGCCVLRVLCNRFFLIFRASASPEEITGLIMSLGEKLTIFFVEEERESRAVG